MFEISIGIMNGEIRPGPRSIRHRVLFVRRVQSADARADEHADFIAVHLFQIHAGIQQRLVAGEDAELREAVRALEFLGRRKSRGRD